MRIHHDIMLIFNFIVTWKETHDGNSPSYREIGKHTGITSTSAVSGVLAQLQNKGLIIRADTGIEVQNGKWSRNGG